MLPPRTSEYLKQSQSEYKIYYFTRTKSYQTKKVVTKLFKFLGWLYILIVIIANLDNNNFFHQYSTVEFPSLCSWRTNRDHRWKSRELNLKSRFWIKQKMYPYQYIIRFGVLLSTLLEISFPILTFHFVCPSQKTLSQRSIFNIMTSILNFLNHFISKTQLFSGTHSSRWRSFLLEKLVLLYQFVEDSAETDQVEILQDCGTSENLKKIEIQN